MNTRYFNNFQKLILWNFQETFESIRRQFNTRKVYWYSKTSLVVKRTWFVNKIIENKNFDISIIILFCFLLFNQDQILRVFIILYPFFNNKNDTSYTKSRQGYIYIEFCLCVCVFVCLSVGLSVSKQKSSQTNASIMMQFSLSNCWLYWLKAYRNWRPLVKGQGHCDRECILKWRKKDC